MTLHLSDVNERLIALAKQKAGIEHKCDDARNRYLQIRDRFELAFEKTKLIEKAIDPTMTISDLKSIATEKTADLKQAMRKAQSEYRKLITDLKSYDTEMEALKEISYNLRQEMRLTPNI